LYHIVSIVEVFTNIIIGIIALFIVKFITNCCVIVVNGVHGLWILNFDIPED